VNIENNIRTHKKIIQNHMPFNQKNSLLPEKQTEKMVLKLIN